MTIHDHIEVLLHDLMVPEVTVSVSANEPKVLEVDVEAAWKMMGLEPRYGDRFKVDIIFPS